jgi:hypothetical protein
MNVAHRYAPSFSRGPEGASVTKPHGDAQRLTNVDLDRHIDVEEGKSVAVAIESVTPGHLIAP